MLNQARYFSIKFGACSGKMPDSTTQPPGRTSWEIREASSSRGSAKIFAIKISQVIAGSSSGVVAKIRVETPLAEALATVAVRAWV